MKTFKTQIKKSVLLVGALSAGTLGISALAPAQFMNHAQARTLSATRSISGKVYDVSSRTLVIDPSGSRDRQHFAVSSSAQVLMSGREVSLTSLQPGQRVTVMTRNGVVTRVVVGGTPIRMATETRAERMARKERLRDKRMDRKARYERKVEKHEDRAERKEVKRTVKTRRATAKTRKEVLRDRRLAQKLALRRAAQRRAAARR